MRFAAAMPLPTHCLSDMFGCSTPRDHARAEQDGCRPGVRKLPMMRPPGATGAVGSAGMPARTAFPHWKEAAATLHRHALCVTSVVLHVKPAGEPAPGGPGGREVRPEPDWGERG